jgi:hypothetical protein
MSNKHQYQHHCGIKILMVIKAPRNIETKYALPLEKDQNE